MIGHMETHAPGFFWLLERNAVLRLLVDLRRTRS
jgi:hypothetical protein